MNFAEQIKQLETQLENATQGLKPLDGANVSITEKHCDQHGAFKHFSRQMVAFPYLKTSTQCPGCLREQIEALHRKQAKAETAKTSEKIIRLTQLSGITKRFAGASFANYVETNENRKAKRVCQVYAEKWLDRKAKGGGLILCGKPGTGKNHLACAILNQVIEQHQDSVLISTALKVVRQVKDSWGKNAEMSETQAVRSFTEVDLLVIDEIGVQFGSEAEKMILFEIINDRYEAMRPTILISNLPLAELSDYIGERVIDRMREGSGAVVTFDWESYRK